MDKLKNSKTIIIGLGLVVLVGLFTAITTVGTGRIGVVTNFGRVTGRELGEGISLKIPFGVESVAIYDIKVQKETAPTAAATKDLQDITAEVVLNYHLNRGDVSRMHQTVGVTYGTSIESRNDNVAGTRQRPVRADGAR